MDLERWIDQLREGDRASDGPPHGSFSTTDIGLIRRSFSETSSPFLQFVNFTANHSIPESGFDRIHIIDFDVGGQWQMKRWKTETILYDGAEEEIEME
ncbi:unnamed protein product [Microthlaspi erraticum]|uniref:Uncharacterized protein n=1 Tax=Microthlaspi erraticum TaxID=1685480 RepID=A0A6D2L6R9_9BRAS|nr:unnamed protein product [Microthlaspi erraticum]